MGKGPREHQGDFDATPAPLSNHADFVRWVPELPWLAVAVAELATHRVIRANRAFLELVGLSELEAARDLDLFANTKRRSASAGSDSATERAENTALDALVSEGVLTPLEEIYVRPDGTQRIAWVTGVVIPNSPNLALIYMLDVTERETNLAALRESEERARRFAQASFEGLIITDGGTIIDVNERLVDMVGTTRDGAIGRSVLEFTDQSFHQTLLRNIANQYDKPYEGLARRVDGTTFPMEVLGKPLPVKGRTMRVTAVRDITERKHTQLALRDAEMALLQAQKLESLGLLAGGIAHDFNNILSIVLGFAAVARRHTADDSPACEALVEIERAAMRAAELARQMLVYSGRSPKTVAELSINDLVCEMTRLLEASFSKKIELSLALHEVPSTVADRVQIQQVVLNLLTNAAEAIGSKRGTIRVETRCAELAPGEVPAAQPGSHLAGGTYVELTVSDDGSGMDEATLGRIFDPFFTTKASAGRGLGLSAMLGILRGHGAGILIESTLGEGSRFKVYFPAAVRPEKTPSKVPSSEPRGLMDGAILLVDDETALRRSTREILEASDYKVFEARDGSEALALFRTHRTEIGLVLLDLVMPQIDGREALAAIRAIDPEARVVLMSGYDAREVLDGIRAEVTGFLAKPYGANALIEAVQKALGQ